MHHVNIESLKSADGLQMLHSELYFCLSHYISIEDDSLLFGILYYRDIFKCIQFRPAQRPVQTHLNVNPVRLTDLECNQNCSDMNPGDWCSDLQDQLPPGVTIVPGLCGF
jgi:hypothetical protein